MAMIPPAPLNGNFDHDFALQMIAHHWVCDQTWYFFEWMLREKVKSDELSPSHLRRHQ